MYSEKDYRDGKTGLRNFILLYCLMAAILIGLIVADQFWRMIWLSYASASLLAIASLFLWGNFGVRLVCWNRFLKEMKVGLERSAAGVIATIDEDEAVKEGLEFRALRLLTGDETDKAGGRLLYVDASRFPLPAGIGQKVNCKIYGNFIKDIEILEED